MANNKWVEVEARSIDDAIKAGLNELNLEDATQANINILREPERRSIWCRRHKSACKSLCKKRWFQKLYKQKTQ